MYTKVTADAGYAVCVVDNKKDILDKTIGGIQTSLKRVAKKKFEKNNDPKVNVNFVVVLFIDNYFISFIFKKAAENYVSSVISRITTTVSLEDAAKNTDLVIEAIIEDMNAKHKLFTQLDKIAPTYAHLSFLLIHSLLTYF